MTKYHKLFGKVEVLSSDEKITVIKLQDGTEKILMTAYTTLSDSDITDNEAIAKEAKRQAIRNKPVEKISELMAKARDNKHYNYKTGTWE